PQGRVAVRIWLARAKSNNAVTPRPESTRGALRALPSQTRVAASSKLIRAEIRRELAVGAIARGRRQRAEQPQQLLGPAADVELFQQRLLLLDRQRQGEAEDVAQRPQRQLA